MTDDRSQTRRGQKIAINMLFEIFSLAYGRTWMTHKTEEEVARGKKLWFSHLEQFSPEEIERGAKQAIDAFPRFPPSLGEFKATLVVRPEHKQLPHLKVVQSSPDVAATAMANLKEKLRINK